MKKQKQPFRNAKVKAKQLKKRKHYSLGELIAAVSSSAKDENETLATLSDLFKSGKVVATSGNTVTRLRLESD